MSFSRWIVLSCFVLAFTAFFYFDLNQLLTLEKIKREQAGLEQLLADNPLEVVGGFSAAYVIATALSLPAAATLLTLVAGALFGIFWGTVIVSFASTIGATLAMVIARWLFQAQVQRRFKRQLEVINRGMDRDGIFYLLILRLVPFFPFFAVNLAMAVTRIKVSHFYVVSQVGMLAGTVVYVNAGTELAKVTSSGDIFSKGLIASLILLGIFPLLMKWIVGWLKARRVYKGFSRPRTFDCDLVVIGAGSGGLVAALIAATLRARVTLIEKNKMGGDCLNTGCVPSKALIRSARFAYDQSHGSRLGFVDLEPSIDFSKIMARVQRVIRTIEPHDSPERYRGLGVDVELGRGEILSPWKVRVNGKVLTTRNIIIATGGKPVVPPIENIDQVDYLTSDTLWQLRELPDRTVVLGGGPIGTELTQTFARLGSQVTQVELLPAILPLEDPEFSELVQAQLESEGVKVLTRHRATAVDVSAQNKSLVLVNAEGVQSLVEFDQLIIAVGRRANTSGFGLEELGVDLNPNGTISVDDFLRTNFPNMYAIGDVAGPYQFTHTASHMAWYASVNALFGSFRKFRVDYSVIPWATFCSPEVARVGINEQEARSQGIDYEVATYDVANLDRAIAEDEALGLVKVLVPKGSDQILGVTIAAQNAGDLIGEFVLAMKHGIGLNKILATIHVYPTFAEMNKFVASEWRKNNKPEWALVIAGYYHRWRRVGLGSNGR